MLPYVCILGQMQTYAYEEGAVRMRSPASGWWLTALRIGCAVLAALCLALFLIELPARYAELAASAPATAGMLRLYADATFALELLVSLGFFVVAAIIFWRRPRDLVALFVSLMLAAFGAALPGTSYALLHGLPIWQAPAEPLQVLGWFLLLPFAYLFPTGRFAPRWTWRLVPFWALWVLTFFLIADALKERSNLFVALSFAVWVAWFGTGVLAQLYRYRYVSTPTQQQQTKWVVFGFALAIIGSGAATLPHIISLSLGQADSFDISYRYMAVAVMNVAALLIPLTIGIAILRHHLFDIDTLINRALVYGSLTATLAALYFGCIIGLQVFLNAFTRDSQLALVASTLLIAALFQPLRRRIQALIDRRFYRRKYNAARTLDGFSATLRQEVDLADLSEHLLAAVEETMQPAHVSLWLLRSPRNNSGVTAGPRLGTEKR